MTSRPVRLVSRVLHFKRLLLASAAILPALLLGEAQAATITISTATTDALKTSTVDAGGHGDIVIDGAGSISLTSAAQPALTLDSANTIENKGSVKISDVDNSIGYLIKPGSGTFTHNGTLELGPANAATTPLHKVYANNKRGLLLDSGGTFTGNIFIKSGPFAVRGYNSVAIDLQGSLVGNLDLTGSNILIVGDHSTGLRIAAPMTGNLTTNIISGVGIGTSGVVVLAPITGSYTHLGSISVTGYDDLTPDAENKDGVNDVQAAQQGGPAIAIGASISKGILINGPSPDDEAAVKAGDMEASELPTTASVTVQSGSNAILISPTLTSGAGGDIVLGVYGTGEDAFGLINRGNVLTSGIYAHIATEVVRIEGASISGTDYHTTINGGFRNDKTISTIAANANATGIFVGNLASVPQILNTSAITPQAIGNDNIDVIGLKIGVGASVPTLTNSGLINAVLQGNTGDATGILDLSGTLISVTNTGIIQAIVAPLDDGNADNGTETASGKAAAFDFSTTANDITVINELPADFDPASGTLAGAIGGEMRFGTGSDTFRVNSGQIFGKTFFGNGGDLFDIEGGTVTSDMSFGLGADTLRIKNGATVTGTIVDADGLLTLDIQKGNLNLTSTDAVAVTSANFGTQAKLGTIIDTTADKITSINASGSITLANGMQIEPVIQGGLESSISGVIFSAPSVDVQGTLASLIPEEALPFLYSASVTKTTSLGIDDITLSLTRKSASELGIQSKLGGALDPIIRILPNDPKFAAAFLDISNQEDFDAAYIQLLPSYSDAMLAVAKQASQASSREIRVRIQDVLISGAGGGAWGSESIYTLDRDSSATDRGYDGQGAVLNLGLDDHLTRNVVLGINFGLDHGSYNENGDFDDPVSMRRWTGGVYGGMRAGSMIVSASTMFALANQSVDRNIVVGSATRTTHGDWSGWRYSANVAASHFSQAGVLYFIPTLGLDYLYVNDDAYTESGGTDLSTTCTTPSCNSVALAVDARSGSAANGYAELVVGVDLSGRQQIVPYQQGQPYVFRPELRVAYSYDFMTDPIDTTARYVGDPQKFTIPSDSRNQQELIGGVGATYETAFGSFGFDVNGVFGDNTTAVIGKFNAAFRF